MNTGLGFTIDWFDVTAGVFALLGVIGVGLIARTIKQLYEIEIGCDPGLYEGDACRCSGIGTLVKVDTVDTGSETLTTVAGYSVRLN